MKNLFRGLYAALIGLLLTFGLISEARSSGNQRTMLVTGAQIPFIAQTPQTRSKSVFSLGQSIRHLFVAEDRLAFC